MKLALKSDPRNILADEMFVGDLNLCIDDVFIVIADLHVMAMMKNQKEPQIAEAILKWHELPRDLDLHLFIKDDKNQYRISYRNTGSLEKEPYATLNHDIRDGFGPEKITFGILSSGKYVIAVHNFSNDIPLKKSNARVELNFGSYYKEYCCPTIGEGRWWVVLEININTGSLTDINEITDDILTQKSYL